MNKSGCALSALGACAAMMALASVLPDLPEDNQVDVASSSESTGEQSVQKSQDFQSNLTSKERSLISHINPLLGSYKIYVTNNWSSLSFKERSQKAKEWYESLNQANPDGSGHYEVFILDSSYGYAKIETGKGLWVKHSSGEWYLNRDWKTRGLDTGWERRDAAMWDESRN